MSSEALKLDGRVAVVTGAASGLGRATAKLFAAHGARLVLVDWDAESLDRVAADVGADAVSGDASDPQTAEAALAAADAAGGVDVVCNIAGIDPLAASTVPATSIDDFDRIMRVNVRSVFLFCRAALPAMTARGGGVIVNCASIAGVVANPNEAAYATSKAAVVNLTRCIALDHAREGIRANVVCPGVLEDVMVDRRREMTVDQIAQRHESEAGAPMGRAGTYDEVARAFLFFASDDSSYCTGTSLVVDGGMIAGYSGHGTTLWSLPEPTGSAT